MAQSQSAPSLHLYALTGFVARSRSLRESLGLSHCQTFWAFGSLEVILGSEWTLWGKSALDADFQERDKWQVAFLRTAQADLCWV